MLTDLDPDFLLEAIGASLDFMRWLRWLLA
jgi:hypothetical protein